VFGARAWDRASAGGQAAGELLVAALIFVVTLLLYLVSPVVTSSDGMFALHIAASLSKGLHGELSSWKAAIDAAPAWRIDGFPYQLVRTPGGIYSYFPIGTPLLAVPYVAVNAALGGHLLDTLDRSIAPWHDHIVASLISAAAAPVLYLAMRRRGASVTASLLAIVAFALGSSLWSIGSRGLWQVGPLMLCYALALTFLARQPLGLWSAAAAGFVLGYAVLVKQTSGLALIAVGAALLIMNWRAAIALALAASPPMLVNAAYDLHAFGWIGNPYMSDYAVHAAWSWEAFAGLLVSPQRGLLVFSPILLFAAYGFIHWRREGRITPLDWSYLAFCLSLWVFVSFWPDWWGGYSYGPRRFADAYPFLTPYLAAAWDGIATRRHALPARAAFIFLLLLTIAIHARGAVDWDVWRWNHKPQLEARLWDWRDLQILYATGRTDAPQLETSGPNRGNAP
jgi:hypothetical protein